MSNWFKPNSIGDYLGALFLMAVFFAGIVIFWRTAVPTAPVNQPPTVAPVVCDRTQVEYEKLVAKGQSVVLTQNQVSYALGSKFIGSKKIVARRGGEIACGYLFAEAHKGSSPLDPKYDSIYIDPQGFGGHLLRSKGIEMTNNDVIKTRVLLPLNAVPYLPSIPYNPDSQDFEVADWARILNAASHVGFTTALSSLNKNAAIDEVRIAYKCIDSATGKETSDCQLSVQE
ncbi:MAG: hypothetical protein WC817_03975 [Patescibacteria group bacterium]|jgi:hypothetical protein